MGFSVLIWLISALLISSVCGFMTTGGMKTDLGMKKRLQMAEVEALLWMQVAPTKPKRKVSNPTREAPKQPTGPKSPEKVFVEPRNIAAEMEAYFAEDDLYFLILFNDAFNKRLYVAQCLTEVLGFSADMADAVMMQAHTNGYAVAGEYYQELCKDYAKRLVDKGIIAEAVKASGAEGE